NGISDYSGSCIVYFFSKKLNRSNENLSDIALVGLAGDYSIGPEGITNHPKEILDDAIKNGLIKVEKGIRIFGHSSRPLHKALEYSFDPYIPNISGNESAVIQFLSELGIEIKDENRFRRFVDLEKNEKEKLASAIILERLANGVEKPTEIFGINYFLTRSIYELNEFATIVNAFGRLERYEEGMNFCLNPDEKKGEQILKEYRTLLGKYLRWAKDNLQKKEGIVFIHAKNNIHPNFIAPVVSVFSTLVDEKISVGTAYDGDLIKVSVRNKTNSEVHKILSNVASQVGGVGGGHKEACGAKIPRGNEERFLSLLEQSLKNVINKKA
ncbi:MAG: DHH family phosphoesterase, partial [Candidatus Aenigmarchaeota archaeon]|nr:DHH family phosphoesterase [Candidatus Aenigmarchaeota archaeon]